MVRSHTVCMRFAHSAGQCGSACTSDGKVLLTSGSDCAVRLHDIRTNEESEPWWADERSNEPNASQLSLSGTPETPLNAVALTTSNNLLATACDDGYVRLYSFSFQIQDSIQAEAELIGSCRFSGSVNALAFSSTGAFLSAAGNEPGVIKLIMTAQPSNVTVLRTTATAGSDAMKAIAFDPLSDFVVTIGERGSACVWSVDSGSLVCAIKLDGRQAQSVDWSPDGTSLVIGTDRGAIVVSRGSWACEQVLTDSDEGGDGDESNDEGEIPGVNVATAVAWSGDGQYLLVGCADARVFLWDMEKRQVMRKWKAEAVIQRVMWHPKHNSFILIDEIGQMGLVSHVIPEHLPKPDMAKNSVEMPTTHSSGNPSSSSKSNLKRIRKLEQTSNGAPPTKKSTDQSPFQLPFDTEDLDVDEEEELAGNGRTVRASSVDASPRNDSGKRYDEEDSEPGEEAHDVVLQDPFIPSSTPPVEYGGTMMRLLYWNVVGVVLSYKESTFSVVEVEFAETARRSIRIKDHFGYSLGCISESGLLLGARKTETNRSSVYFRPFYSWSTNSEWTHWLPDDEIITVLALGSQFAAICSEPRNIVRIFSLSGIQVDVFCYPGYIITMTAVKDHLAVVYNVRGSSGLRLDVLRLSKHAEVVEVVYSGSTVITPNSKLEWIGFTGDGHELAVYDSSGCLYLLCRNQNWKRWVPMLMNVSEAANCNWFWVTAVTSKTVLGVSCHSTERFPAAKPRPLLRSLPLVAPIIQPSAKTGKASVEERYYRSKLEVDRADFELHRTRGIHGSGSDLLPTLEDKLYRTEVEMDKCILALMQEACRGEQNVRALDLATRLRTRVSFKYATELAKYFKRSNLAARIEQLTKVRFSEERDQEEDATSSFPTHELKKRKLSKVNGNSEV